MATETKPGTSRKRHSPQYKAEALALAERVGVQLLPSNLDSMKASCIPGASKIASIKSEAS